MSTAMGQELEDDEILCGALTVGGTCNVPASKFNHKGADTPYVFTDEDNVPLYQRVIPAEDNQSRTIIMPANLIRKLVGSIVNVEGGEGAESLVQHTFGAGVDGG